MATSDIRTGIAHATVPASTGFLEVTAPGLNCVPKACMVFSAHFATAQNSLAAHMGVAMGWASQSSKRAGETIIAMKGRDAVGTTLDIRTSCGTEAPTNVSDTGFGFGGGSTAVWASVAGDGGNSAVSDGSMTAIRYGAGPIKNGWKFYVDAAPSTAREVTVVFFGGDDYTGYAGNVAQSSIQNSPFTGLGFTPTAIFTSHNASEYLSQPGDGKSSWGLAALHAFGAARSVGTTGEAEATRAFRCDNNQTTTRARVGSQEGVFNLKVANEGAGTTGWVNTSWTPSSGQFSWSTPSGGTWEKYTFLVSDFGDCDVYIDWLEIPTTTGRQTVSAPGFRPQLVLGCVSPEQTNPAGAGYVLSSDSEASGFGIFAGNTDTGGCAYGVYQDGVTTSVCKSYHSTSTVKILTADGTSTLAEGSVVEFTDNGFVIDWSAVHTSNLYILIVALEQGTPTTPWVPTRSSQPIVQPDGAAPY